MEPKESASDPAQGSTHQDDISSNGANPGVHASSDAQSFSQFYRTTTIADLLRRRFVSAKEVLLTLYDHGYVNGLYRTSKEHYHQYVASSQVVEHLEFQIKIYEDRRLSLAHRFDLLFNQAELDSNHKFVAESSIRTIEHEEGYRKAELQNRLIDLARLNERLLKQWPMHTFATGFFYLVAAMVFIVADFVITKNIVANAMEMDGFDAFIFAAALASTSFLFKPMYDRLIEKPYRENTNRIRFAVFIIILAMAVVALLTILGVFRFEAYKLNQSLASAIASDNVVIDLVGVSPLDTEVALWSFILSAVIFAIAGGVSMGIGLPVINDHWQTRFMAGTRRKLEDTVKSLHESLNKLTAEKERYIALIKSIALRQSMLSTLDSLKQEVHDIHATLIDLHQQKMTKRAEALQHLYADAYARGEKLSDDVIEAYWKEVHQNDDEDVQSGIGDTFTSNGKGVQYKGRTRARPFISLRRKIHEDYKKGLYQN